MTTRTTELRDYRIAPGRLEDFVHGWRSGVVPLRRAHGFRVDGAWVVVEDHRFVWVLSLDVPPDEWEARNAAYYADPRRLGLVPDPAELILEARHTLLAQVELPADDAADG